MATNEQKLQKNTYNALSKCFLKREEWTKQELMGVLMDMPEVYAGGRLIQRWLDSKVALGFLVKEGDLYRLNK